MRGSSIFVKINIMKIILVRHGQDTDNENKILNGHRDTELTDLGIEQARTVAQKIKDDNVDVVISSPLKRTMETAEIIANELGLEKLKKDRLLVERDFGILTGKPLSKINEYADEVVESNGVNYFLKGEGVEEFPECYARAETFINKVSDVFPNKTIVAVTHGDIGKMIRAAYHGWTWKQGLKTTYFDNAEALHLKEKKDFIE